MGTARASQEPARERGDRDARHRRPALATTEGALDAVTRLQRTAGNRAVVTLLGLHTVQRHPGPTLAEEVETNPGTGTGSPAPAGPDYPALARDIRDAIEGLGTDEDAVYGALAQCGRDPQKIAALAAEYQKLTGRGLEADIRDDFSGSELARALRLMRGPNRQEQIEAAMRTTTSGQWALKVIADHSVEVDWEYTGQGSFHRGGKIFLNKTLAPNGAAVTMMHEAQHALTYKTGKAADVEELTRAAYVKAKIADEAEAVVRSIEGAAPMQKAGVDITGGGITAGLITRYQTAYNAAAKALRDKNPDMDAAEVHRQARTTTRDGEITSWFHDGTFVTSTGNITYSEHYGKIWDDEHKPPADTPTPVAAQ
jgi:hypothetical protein